MSLTQVDFPEIMRFGVIGVAATATHFLTLTGAVELLGIPPSLANGIAFLVAIFATYIGQAFWVFRRHSRHGRRQVTKFAVSLAIGFALNVTIMALIRDVLGLDYLIGFLVSTITVPMVSFGVNKFWVFRHGPT